MENKKYMQKTENISHFVDKQTIKTHPFGDNKMGERAYRRAERLVAAIHLLTNHVESDEPIRRTVREKASSLLGDILELRDELRTVGSPKVYYIEASIRHLISLVRILAVSGFVSFENADILTDALDDLGSFIESSKRSVLSESVRLSRDEFLDVRDNSNEYIKDSREVSRIKDTSPSRAEDARNFQSFAQKDRSFDRPLNRRMESIIEVLRMGKDLGIREIATNLPEYSEKMIQRELADLVAMGWVTKLGLKRWSKYVLPDVLPVMSSGMSAGAQVTAPSPSLDGADES